MAQTTPVIPATTSSGLTSNAVALVNTFAAWGILERDDISSVVA